MARDPGYPRTLPTPRLLAHGTLRRPPPDRQRAGAKGTPRLPPTGSKTGFANGTPRWPPSGSTAGFALSPTPPQGGSDYCCSLQGLSYSPQVIPPPIPPKRPFKHSSITPPLRGSRRSPSRMAKASAVGGSHKASQRRDLVRRRGFAPTKLQAMAAAVGGNAGPRLRQHSHLG